MIMKQTKNRQGNKIRKVDFQKTSEADLLSQRISNAQEASFEFSTADAAGLFVHQPFRRKTVRNQPWTVRRISVLTYSVPTWLRTVFFCTNE